MEQTDLSNRCEFCGYSVLLTVISDHPSNVLDFPRAQEHYVVCANCHLGLITLSLAPWQFLRAKERGGDVTRYYLHDDFYMRETGEAIQPKMESLTHIKPYLWGEPPKDSEVEIESDSS